MLIVLDPKPPVPGYVRIGEPGELQIAMICKDLSTFCKLSGFRLGSLRFTALLAARLRDSRP